MTDPRHLLLVGTGPGLGAAIARRVARERYRLTLVARSEATIATSAQQLRAAGADVAVVQADAGDPERLRAALSSLFARPGAPGVVIYNAALMTFDDLLTVSPKQLADAYAVDVIGGVLTAQLAVPTMRGGRRHAAVHRRRLRRRAPRDPRDALARQGRAASRGDHARRQLRDDDIHAGSLTILGQIAAGTPFDPDSIADAYWAICNEPPDAWREENRFEGAEAS